jgi:hypothetical protein
MAIIFRTLRAQWAGFLALFVALAGVAGGATGDFLRLGGRNAADRTTAVRNTGNGAAFEFVVESGEAPFTVSSSGLVQRLNSFFLQGKTPADFAPASGSPNYVGAGTVYTKAESDNRFALASGDPNYLPADSAYTKSESDRRYAPVTGSEVYVGRNEIFTREQLYTKRDLYNRREADRRYAPAEGSPNYLASDGPQVLAAASAVVDLTVGQVSAPVLLPTAVFAPVDGTITVLVAGYCTRGQTGDLALRAKVGGQDAATTYSESGGCATVAFKQVEKDETVSVAAFLTTKLAGDGSSAVLSAQVLFQPAEPAVDADGVAPSVDDVFPPRPPARG